MANYITEDDIEVSLINILKSDELAYNVTVKRRHFNFDSCLTDDYSLSSESFLQFCFFVFA